MGIARFRQVLFAYFLVAFGSLFAQFGDNPVTWDVEIIQGEDNEYEIRFEASIAEGWYIYSQDNDPNAGPIPTKIEFNENADIALEGGIVEESSHLKEGLDPIWNQVIKKYSDEVTFVQSFTVSESTSIKGYYEYMTCNDESCMPPEYVEFSLDVDFPDEGSETDSKDDENLDQDTVAADSMSNSMTDSIPTDLDSLSGQASDEVTEENTASSSATSSEDDEDMDCAKEFRAKYQLDLGKKGQNNQKKDKSDGGVWTLFLLGFGGGLLALLTPCVFPMIPLTVTFFTKGDGGKGSGWLQAALYGFFITLVYVLISLPFHLIDGLNPNILNEISTSPALNIFFFVVFVFFAISFFGAFEITLPPSLANRVSNAEQFGGVIGTFFMALTLCIVSFSCTGPILGSAIVTALSSQGGAVELTMAMLGFGLALALPFTLFAAFPSLLNKLPRSGGWMKDFKVILGFAELALALKFLSNADLVLQLGLLKYELFIIAWAIISILAMAYLFGWLSKKTMFKKPTRIKGVFASLFLVFACYLMMGLSVDSSTGRYKPRTILSGFPPPVCYSYLGCEENKSGSEEKKITEFKNNIVDAKAQAEMLGRPMLFDFTGHACVNCRKVEEQIWTDQRVHKLIEENFILTSLYVDERTILSKEEQCVVMINGQDKLIRTEGDIWATAQAINFRSVTQPLYVILAPDETQLTPAVGYSEVNTVEKYKEFLEDGLETFEQWKEEQKEVEDVEK
ncbi:MAG: cytochrome c biogenesis protein CcdA [Bacteroidota bacterium]|nr:cytochrome c biogenesis protein CcdA [Bacteroidota bacterium]